MIYLSPLYSLIGFSLLMIWSFDFFGYKKIVLLNSVSLNRKSYWFKITRLCTYFIGMVGILCMTYSVSNPSNSVGVKEENIFVKDIYFVVDVSLSMLSEDFKPNRLEVAKNKIKDFVSLRPTDRIGIVAFSDNAFTLLPLTIDNLLVKKIIKEIKVGYLGSGTNIGDALALAVGRLKKTKVKNKFIILLTDGVSNSGILTPLEAAKIARDAKIKIYSIGIGKLKNGRYLKGGFNGYRNIPGGSVDLKTMKQISRLTKGQFFYAGNSESLSNILSEIQKLEKTMIKANVNFVYNSFYYVYFVVGLILFLLSESLRRFFLKEAI